MSNLPLFKLEEFWKKFEFSSPYLLCPSDSESWQMNEILAMGDEETIKQWNSLSLSYTESPGLPLLRGEIAKLYSSLNEQNILTTAGAEEGIHCALHSLLSPGDHVVLVTPTYQSLQTIPQSIGVEIATIQLDYSSQWKLDFEQIQAVWRPTTKCLIHVCPPNPTGTLLDKETFSQIISLARKTGSYIFFDEVYRYLELELSMRLPAIADAYEKGISLNVMTKSFGLAGLRIGWLASKDKEFLAKANSNKMYTSICNSAPSEILALIALRSKEAILTRNRMIQATNIKLLDDFVARHPKSIRWVRPESGTVGLMELLLPISIEQFTEQLVEKKGVLVMPGDVFDLPGHFFRIGFGRRNMAEALQHFEEFLLDYENLYQN